MRSVLSVCAIAVTLAGCGAMQQSFSPPATRAQSRSPRSWMLPKAKSQDLLYISDLGTNSVDVFTYPKGQQVGKITGFGSVETLCSDKAGDVFIVDEAGPVDVFSHGGSTPVRQLTATGAPEGCSVDPTTGDLALTNGSSYLYGTIAIYPKAKGKSKAYFDDTVDATYFCGYDDKGNLFIDGWNRSGQPIFLEFPKSHRGFAIADLKVKVPGGVLWDGKYVAVSDVGAGVIHRLSATGHSEQTVKLRRGADVYQFWIFGSTIVGPDAVADGTTQFWHYPAGGSPTKTIEGFSYPIGSTISLAH